MVTCSFLDEIEVAMERDQQPGLLRQGIIGSALRDVVREVTETQSTMIRSRTFETFRAQADRPPTIPLWDSFGTPAARWTDVERFIDLVVETHLRKHESVIFF